jgi:heme oxygenase (biliverdin-IX-beta and delta-forming)
MIATATDIMARLKHETAGQHQQTEQLLYADRIMSATLSLTDYVHLLTIQATFHRSLEKAIHLSGSFFADFDWQSRQKTGWLLTDLNDLDQPFPEPDNALFAHWGGHQLLGALYVAEGSMLGGRFIVKALARNPALADAPTRFYTGYGDLTGPNWKNFGQYLTARAPGHDDEIVDGATRAFDSFNKISVGLRA